jgi:hypothetical protein
MILSTIASSNRVNNQWRRERVASEHILGIKKELSDISTKVFVMNQFSARQNNAIISLTKLQSHGVTEDQLLAQVLREEQ